MSLLEGVMKDVVFRNVVYLFFRKMFVILIFSVFFLVIIYDD